MSRLLCLSIISWSFSRGVLVGQALSMDAYVTGMTLIGKPGAGPACPTIVWLVEPDTPAAKAGIHPATEARYGREGRTDIVQTRTLLHSSEAKSGTIELEGEGGPYAATVERIPNSLLDERKGWKRGPDGGLFPKDATPAEMHRISQMQGEPATKVFSVGHYPANQELYYPGFEIFVWPEPQTITVGGSKKGQLKAAGVHYGDPFIAVNGMNPRGKSFVELERLFSSPTPATMTLVIDRDGQTTTFTFQLARASDIAAANRKRQNDSCRLSLRPT